MVCPQKLHSPLRERWSEAFSRSGKGLPALPCEGWAQIRQILRRFKDPIAWFTDPWWLEGNDYSDGKSKCKTFMPSRQIARKRMLTIRSGQRARNRPTKVALKAYGNPIHRPATATVPQSASETPATSLFREGLIQFSSTMTTLRRKANVKRRARTRAAIFIQKAFM